MTWETGRYPRAIRHIKNANNLTVKVGPDTFRLYTPNPEGFLCIKESRYKNIRDLLEDMKIE